MNKYKNLTVISHPIVQDRLTRMRCKTTSTEEFKRYLHEISILMGYVVTANLTLKSKEIETPLTKMTGQELSLPNPVIVPILRAGLGLSDGLQQILPFADFGHIGVYRNEETKRPVEYLIRLPDNLKDRKIFLVDPMLATGYSAKYAVDILLRKGALLKNIVFMCLLAAPEGVDMLTKEFTDLPIFTASLDERLNEKAYIVPGLGDAGDRLFGTL